MENWTVKGPKVAQARNRRLFRQAGCQADEGEVYLDHQKRCVPFGAVRSILAGRDKNILADSSWPCRHGIYSADRLAPSRLGGHFHLFFCRMARALFIKWCKKPEGEI